MARASAKSPDAFRTISEAADVLDLPQHVLRFWETRFSQIKPMKRSGGRRYYRPSDIALLKGIRHLLYDEGYTIKGVQRILREQGIAHVAGFGQEPVSAAPPSEARSPGGGESSGHNGSGAAHRETRPDPVRALLNPALGAPATTSGSAREPVPAAVQRGVDEIVHQERPTSNPPPAPSSQSSPTQSSSSKSSPTPSARPMAGLWFAPQPDVSVSGTTVAPPDAAHGLPPDTQPTQPVDISPAPSGQALPGQPVAPPLTPARAASLSGAASDQHAVSPTASAQPSLPPQPSSPVQRLTAAQSEALADALQILMECKTTLDHARGARTQGRTADSAIAAPLSNER